MQQSYRASAFLVASLLSFPMLGLAEENKPLRWSLGADIVYDDNVDLLPSGGQDETIGSVQGAVVLAEQGTRYVANLWASANYLNYFQDTYTDDTVWGVSGDLALKIVPDVFDWKLVGNYGPYWLDPLSSDTPDNRAYVKYIETGPRITIGGGGRNRAVVEASYARTIYSSEADATKTDDLEYWLGDIALIHDVNLETSWSVHADGQRTSSLDDPAKSDYDIYNGYVRVETAGGRTRLSADGGISRLDYADDPKSTPLIRLQLDRQLSAQTTLSIVGGTGYVDTAGWFVRLQGDAATSNLSGTVDVTGVNDTQDVTALNAPLKQEYATLSTTFNGRQTTIALGGGYSKEDFESTSNLSEQTRWGYFILLSRQLTDSIWGSIRANQQLDDYNSADQNDQSSTVDATLTWSLGRGLSLVGQYGWGRQNSNVNALDYTYNSIGIGIYYSLDHRPVMGGSRR